MQYSMISDNADFRLARIRFGARHSLTTRDKSKLRASRSFTMLNGETDDRFALLDVSLLFFY